MIRSTESELFLKVSEDRCHLHGCPCCSLQTESILISFATNRQMNQGLQFQARRKDQFQEFCPWKIIVIQKVQNCLMLVLMFHLEQGFSTTGSRPSNGTWKILNGSRPSMAGVPNLFSTAYHQTAKKRFCVPPDIFLADLFQRMNHLRVPLVVRVPQVGNPCSMGF